MLDQLEMVIRRYQNIAPHAGTEMTLAQAEQLGEWLEIHVGGVTASLLNRPEFRRRVRWSIEQLTGEFEGPERQTVIAVDRALVRYAQALSAVARREDIWEQLLQLGPYGGKVPKSHPSALDPPHENQEGGPLPLGLGRIEYLAQRPWRDLVSAWDFFHPAVQFNFHDPEIHQWASFLPYVNKRLRVPGDFVTRCMEIRIEMWQEDLQKFWVRCDTARRNAGIDLEPQWHELQEIRVELNAQYKALRGLCFNGREGQLRDSCVALFQIFAGFHQDADVGWLGPAAKMMAGAADIPHRVTRMRQWDVPERAVAALIDIADLVRRPQAPEDLIEEMKSTKQLVLIEEQREGFLNGTSINASQKVSWHKAELQWEFLWTLADRALLKRSVDRSCLSNPNAKESREPPSQQAVKDRRADLKKLITPELNALIVDAGVGTYRLEIEPEEICLLGWLEEERLTVLLPTPPRH